ncbi:MAG: hypothetical protein EAZ92_14935 [Candidatus Kapaibacterium sp.]|nr:MAG: hypothetical protein EAZ92_14935 [Candidatus Kapabacteria bacterium]
MNTLRLNPKYSDQERREAIYNGNLLLHTASPAVTNLRNWADELISEAFGAEPQKAQYDMAVEQFVTVAGPLKSKFTNHQKTKELIRDILKEFGCDLERTYFDVPRLRVVSSDGYLTAGVGYAYKAHRDSWYGAPDCQLNWWFPIYDLDVNQTMSMYTNYWAAPIQNSSDAYNHKEWIEVGRTLAASQITTDTRKHPLPTEKVDESGEMRIVSAAAEMLVFSGSYLHATAPNTSGKTRFSIDFRTISLDDLLARKGAPNVDCKASGLDVYLKDFLLASDFSPIADEYAAPYADSARAAA